MNQNQSFTGKMAVIIMAALILAGCATNLSKPAHGPMPTKIRFGEFKNVEMRAVGISDSFAASHANQKVLRRIDQILFTDMRIIFPYFKRIEHGSEFSKGEDRTLQIVPYIKEVKFVAGGVRWWVGPVAGSSAILMQVTFRDSLSGEIIAEPEFYRISGAWVGSMTVGATDNKLLSNPTTIHVKKPTRSPVYVSGVRDKLDGSLSVSMRQVQ